MSIGIDDELIRLKEEADLSQYTTTETCPKCGGDDRNRPEAKYSEEMELLTLTCGRCGYKWHRRPLDADKGKGLDRDLH